MIDKLVPSFDAAVADIPDGAVIHFGGFASPFNTPNELIAAVARLGVTGLTAISTWMGLGEEMARSRAAALGALRRLAGRELRRRLPRGARAHPARDHVVPRRVFAARAVAVRAAAGGRRGEVEVTGQGTLAERIRAAKAGIAAFYTPVGPGTAVADGKEARDFDGVPHVLEHALPADFALIRAQAADRFGNLVYHGPRTFNQTMAGAATVTIAEVDEVVPLGALDGDAIHTPGVYVQRVVVRPRTPHASWQEPR